MKSRTRETMVMLEASDKPTIDLIRKAGIRCVAARAGVSKTYVSLWINRKVWARMSTANRIIDAAKEMSQC